MRACVAEQVVHHLPQAVAVAEYDHRLRVEPDRPGWIHRLRRLHRLGHDLVGRDLLTLGAPENRALALLGPPDEREAGRQYWLTGRWHSASDTCLVVVFGSDGRLRRFALVKLAGRASLTFHCAAGTLLPQSLPAASKR